MNPSKPKSLKRSASMGLSTMGVMTAKNFYHTLV